MGVPGRIVELGSEHPHLATIEVMGVEREVNIGLIEPDGPQPGDWVDVHIGMALSILDEEEAKQILDWLERLAEGSFDPIGDPEGD